MLNIKNYHRAQSLKEAYELNLNKNNVVLGGMLWQKMQSKNVATAIDLCDLNLDKIEERETEYHIGAMVTLRDIERSESLNGMTDNAIRECLKDLVGVQFRNLATVGGSVFSKFGFSDITTLLLALGAKVEFYNKGVISLEDFLKQDYERDLLVRVIVEKRSYNTVFMAQKNSKTDFPVLNCAVTENEKHYKIVIGARPLKAEIITFEKQDDIKELAKAASEKFTFGDNKLASASYRKHICSVLIMRACEQLNERR